MPLISIKANLFRKWFADNRIIILYIIGLFVLSRIILTLVGYTSLQLFSKDLFADNICMIAKKGMVPNDWVSVWFNWDSGHYYSIAQYGYRVLPPNYGFFPLYPLVTALVAIMPGLGTLTAGLLVSNISLLIACWLLYKLVLLDSPKEVARRSVKYFLLMPVAFLFSAMLSEATFVMLAIGAFYFARRQKWWYAGLLSMLLALTRSLGVFIVLPLLIEYLQQINFSWRKLTSNVLALALAPIGLLSYMVYNHWITGDYLAFAKLQKTQVHNPVEAILRGFNVNEKYFLALLIAAGLVVVLIILRKKLRFSLWLYSIIFSLIPLLTGPKYYPSLLRYLLVVFPIAIILSKLSEKKEYDDMLTIGLALLQGGFIIFWANCGVVYFV